MNDQQAQPRLGNFLEQTMMEAPTADEITTTRQAAGLTQAKSAHLVHVAIGTWKQYESGIRTPHVALWELYLLKTGQHQNLCVAEKSQCQ